MQSWHFIDGKWRAGNPAVVGPNSHALWLGSCVFDGARAFEGVTPDLDLHCERVVASARAMGLDPHLSAGELLDIAHEGLARFPKETALYIRPMFWAESGFVVPDPASTRFCFSLNEMPMPEPRSCAVMLSSFRRPHPKSAPTDAKAACLYPNAARALKEAMGRGFDNAVVLDGNGNVAELATANLWLAKDGVAVTPAANGTFLNGITRQRVAKLLQEAGVPVQERTVTWEELLAADELFSSGNYGKVLPITRIDGRDLQPGPVYTRARQLYWDFAHGRL
jgi:branched-chain amino acid aminotransferase